MSTANVRSADTPAGSGTGAPLALSELIARVKHVYSLPQTFHHLNETVSDPNSSMSDIGDVLMSDQALSARILQLANSSFYGFPSRIDTVSHAVTMIGAEQLVALVQGTCVASIFTRIPRELVDMESFWKHCIGCGIAARLIAARRREPNTERFFLLGLLHDIGRLVIFQHLPSETTRMLSRCAAEGRPLHEIERETLGYDHAAVGGELLRSWKLPGRLCEPIATHHVLGGSRVYPDEGAILHVADFVAHGLAYGNSGDPFVPRLHDGLWQRTALGTSGLPPLAREIERQFAEVARTILN